MDDDVLRGFSTPHTLLWFLSPCASGQGGVWWIGGTGGVSSCSSTAHRHAGMQAGGHIMQQQQQLCGGTIGTCGLVPVVTVVGMDKPAGNGSYQGNCKGTIHMCTCPQPHMTIGTASSCWTSDHTCTQGGVQHHQGGAKCHCQGLKEGPKEILLVPTQH
jgi:hypothetical protein